MPSFTTTDSDFPETYFSNTILNGYGAGPTRHFSSGKKSEDFTLGYCKLWLNFNLHTHNGHNLVDGYSVIIPFLRK
jgi:hypothetical protein